jgi:hypothetical protein
MSSDNGNGNGLKRIHSWIQEKYIVIQLKFAAGQN